MLVVLTCSPVTAPFEASLGEKFEAEVVVVYLVGEVPVAVTKDLSRGGLDEERAIITHLIVRVVERVDVNGQSTGMLRQISAACDGTVAEARRVVVAHLCLVISIIDIGQQSQLII